MVLTRFTDPLHEKDWIFENMSERAGVDYGHGVLTVTSPVRTEARRRKVPLAAGGAAGGQ